jgi:hypothetical protein
VLPASGVAASGGESSISIEPNAQYFAFSVDVAVRVNCTGGSGVASVVVSQSPPVSAFPSQGSGGSTVICDGHEREFAVVACCGDFNIGKADAVASLNAPSGTATATKTINITF